MRPIEPNSERIREIRPDPRDWIDEEVEAEVANCAGSRHARTFSGNFEIGFQAFHSTCENKPRLRGINETPAVPRVAFRLGEFLFGTLPALRRGVHRLLSDLANRIQTAGRGIGLFKIGHLPKLDRRPAAVVAFIDRGRAHA